VSKYRLTRISTGDRQLARWPKPELVLKLKIDLRTSLAYLLRSDISW
jgi:hypothetical protein